MNPGPLRILFASVHGYIDPSSGAALSARHLLELLVRRGHDCRVLSTGVLDYPSETPLGPLLARLGVRLRHGGVATRGGRIAEILDLTLEGVRVTLLPTASSRIKRSPNPNEAVTWLDLADRALAHFRPQILLTYGGHPASLELMARARRRGVAVVFFLRNLAYQDRRCFADVSSVLVPSQYSQRHYAHRLGLDCTALPSPLCLAQVVATNPEPKYLTFINPVPSKGLPVFARIAAELARYRPDIPLLVVEGRGTAEALAHVGLDLSSLGNLYRMASTPDPRTFWRISRAVLVPSLCAEASGRVAAEGLANGLPVLASDRGGLPETLGDAGFLFAIPERCTPRSGFLPTAHEVGPWLGAIEQLWDDPAFEADHRRRAFRAARRWDEPRIAAAYEAYFQSLAFRTGAESRHDEPVKVPMAPGG